MLDVKYHKSIQCTLKVVAATFLLVSFLGLKESTYETRESFFYFTSKALFVLEKIKSLEFQIFKCHAVIKYWSIKKEMHLTEYHGKAALCWWKLTSLDYITQKKNQKISNNKKLKNKKLFQVLLCLQRIKQNLYQKIKFLNQATYVYYVIASYQNLSKSAWRAFYRGFLQNEKGLGIFSRSHFSHNLLTKKLIL